MTVKRFENRLNKDNVKFNTLNPVWDNEKQDALNVFEMIDLLNELHEENQSLKKKLEFFYELNKPYETIIEENKKLKSFINRLTNDCGEIILMNGIGYNVKKIFGDFE